MDQSTFRSFLTTPRPGAAAASTSAASSSSRASLGGAAPKRAAGYNPYTTAKPATREYNADDGAPKAKKTWVSKKSDKYVDRAAARRQGLDNEFTEVIAVRDEFERRQEGDDAADVEAKRQLLGGDAEHSILVKGLDLALLARNKAALDATQAESDDEDDVLEAAYGAGASTDLVPAVDDELSTGRKRSREEILAAVQSKRRALAGGSGSRAAEPVASDLNRSKFKPIGFKEEKKSKKKAVVGPDGHVKKLKKKTKVRPAEVEPTVTAAAPAPAGPDADLPVVPAPVEGSPSGPSSPLAAPAAASAAPARPTPAEKRFAKPLISADLSDDDIFGGVGEYEGDVPSDSDDDEGAPKASTSTEAAGEIKGEQLEAPVPKVNWFKTGRTPSPPPAPIGVPYSPKGKERATDDGDEANEGGWARSPLPEPVMRLVPLSGTSARDMLARAEAAEQAAVRRLNKAKWRQSQGLAKQADGAEDDDEDEGAGQGGWRGKEKVETVDKKRLNHDFQQYQNYVKKLDK